MKSIKVENIAMGSSGVASILTVMGGYKRIPAFSMSERKGAVLLGQKSEETTLWKLLELDNKAYTFIKWHAVFPFLYLYISSWGPPVSTKKRRGTCPLGVRSLSIWFLLSALFSSKIEG